MLNEKIRYRAFAMAVMSMTTVMLAGASSAHALTVLSINPGPPVVDGADIANLGAATGSEKLWTDTRAIGQSFTTGNNPLGYDLGAITLRSHTDAPATKRYTLTVGTVTGTTYGAFFTESNILQGVNSLAGDYWTFLFSSPIHLNPNTLYGFDLAMNSSTTAWQSGIPYRSINSSYTGGAQFRSSTNATSTAAIGFISGDKVFHLNMTATTANAVVPEPATAAMALLTMGGLALRRRRTA